MPATKDNFTIKYDDGSVLNMASDLFTLVRSFSVESPNPTVYRRVIQGKPGATVTGRDLNERKIRCVCELFALNEVDYTLAEKELYKALYKDAEFYVVQDAMPTRQWRVTVDEAFTPTQSGPTAEFTITFTIASGFAESIGALDDPQTFDYDWSFADNIPLYEDFSYTHTIRSFAIYNLGDVPLDPNNAPIYRIYYTGASNGLTIENRTTGDVWRYSGTTGAGDTLTIDTVFARVNGLPVTERTNWVDLRFAPGRNDIRITGTSGSFEIKFDFRFLYF
ncbi:phage tail family protein [Alkalihalobacillus sp. LMS6]|uniref:phage tail family protein n=1 Tax=Alkalihalobacillus sp. LMS6 TaxID=2924034 RepID=UPI0020D00A08|nr:phage tail family protein [Alkalihalobacillus sp. LMS6]UTR05138.1 phage tail family protein [Alkalihalobacillus sp. LMS6]